PRRSSDLYQFGCEAGQSIKPSLRRSVFNGDILILDVSELFQPAAECFSNRRNLSGSKEPDSSDRSRLLGVEWRREDAEGESDCECHANDHHAATAVCWLSTAAIFRQPS